MRDKMRKLRIDRNYTQEYVAEKSGISRPTYTSIELGNIDPSLKVALNLKRVFEYYDDDIFLNENVTKSNNENDDVALENNKASQEEIMNLKEVKELRNTEDVNRHLKDGWVLVNILTSTQSIIYIVGRQNVSSVES